jgi:hypothetical protein
MTDIESALKRIIQDLDSWCDTWTPNSYTDPRISLKLIADRARVAIAKDGGIKETKTYRSTDLGDGAVVIYVPWEETPGGTTTPKPEGYDEMYAEFGLGPLAQ